METKRNVYLNMVGIQQAQDCLFEKFGHLETGVQTLDVVQAQNRVLAAPAVAVISSPNFHAAAMDGVAVDAESTFGANDEAPKSLTIGKTAFWVNTGQVLPDGTNAVIMIEHLNILDENTIGIEAPAFPWQYVRKMGEDIVATQLLFPRDHKINAYAMGALLSGGVFKVSVRKRPGVLIIPTGSELKRWQDVTPETMKPGDVVESNATVLTALCADHGADATVNPMLEDDLQTIQAAVSDGVDQGYDMVMILGGSSAGSKDYSKPVIENLGRIYVHGVTMMPGKPLMFGGIGDTPVFGIPGYPVSAIVAFEMFAGPLLLAMQHLPPLKQEVVAVSPVRKVASKLGREEFLRVKIGAVDGRLMSSQLPRGAGSITTLTEADGIIRIPQHVEGIEAGKKVQAHLLRPLDAIENTVVITGSHDNTLDLLSDQIRLEHPGMGISSSHVGSMGGLMTIKKRGCHMAGCHLLDPDDGTYNISYIKKYLPDVPVRLVNLVMRQQGLILPKGNPDKVKRLSDIAEKNVTFINRQPGSGTRILFDFSLKENGLSAADVSGYENEEYTHMSVAVAVLSGRAGAGLGIKAAALALKLDFLPVVTESYDLVIPEIYYHLPKVQALICTIQSAEFKQRVMALGGYGVEQTGEELFRSV
ncbi:molybdopterin biosynthesis protein [Desulfobacter latus]|uniref:Molybdopterin molybdenumtransferase n=1 Tax=Desulfobacter latus TaxID=2292 RepID=A0A850STW2_9BACT|nr:molybdopterin biosynthesis protein [Desulfobacter latus]NWH03450.1 molybdopterin biosynthesis protein [Desulfobacter latus]